MYRILLDQDSVLYDLDDQWLKQHNEDCPDHQLQRADFILWDRQKICTDNNCAANIYSYFDNVETWRDGTILGNSESITAIWQRELPVELGILTTAANSMSMQHKVEWLTKHFPHIPNIMLIYNAHIKHWVSGDILIDDGIHNVENFSGIRVLYDQPWNQNDTRFIRAQGITDNDKWKDVDRIVRSAIQLLDNGYKHRTVEMIIKDERITWLGG